MSYILHEKIKSLKSSFYIDNILYYETHKGYYYKADINSWITKRISKKEMDEALQYLNFFGWSQQ